MIIFITYLLLSPMVKEFWKSVNKWQSYGKSKGVLFFDSLTQSPSMAIVPAPSTASLVTEIYQLRSKIMSTTGSISASKQWQSPLEIMPQ